MALPLIRHRLRHIGLLGFLIPLILCSVVLQDAYAQPPARTAKPARPAARESAARRLGLPELDLDVPDERPRPRPRRRPRPRPHPGVGAYRLGDTVVTGTKRLRSTPTARYEVKLGKLKIVPRKSAAEHLMLAPGVLTTNHGGEGHAHSTYMRGFAAGEGKDIEFTLGGVPLNEVSNAHNHGYTDVLFLPPEFLKTVTITEGPFLPSQGDFAFAGSANYVLGISERGSLAKYGIGLWNTHRLLMMIAPRGQDEQTFGGFEFYRTDGFGPNRAAQRALGLGSYARTHKRLRLRWRLGFFGYAARYDQPGPVRQDDLATGQMGFYDTYDTNQGGESNRFLGTFHLEVGPRRSRFRQVAWFGYRTMRNRVNWTGWMLDDLTDGEVIVATDQRGDGTEMRYKVFQAGSRGRYTVSRNLLKHEQQLALGYLLRFDHGESSQRRLRAVTAIPYRAIFDHEFTVLNLAGWVSVNFRPLSWLAIRGGLRLDTFSFGVTDFNQLDSDREGVRLPDQTAQAFGYALNPRFTVDFTLYKGLHLVASYGQGTRSTEAAALSDNETAPFALSQQMDGGLTYEYGRPGGTFHLKAQASYVYAYVNKDLLFSETAGRNELVGSTTRHAALLGVRAFVGRWFDALLNFGWTHAVLNDTGELLPYVPRVILRLDTGVRGNLFRWTLGGIPVQARGGLGFTYVPGVPLPYKELGEPWYLLNLGGEIRLWKFSLGIELRNLLNRRYRQSEFNYASNFRGPTVSPSQVAMRHFVAGEPFYVMGTVTVHMEELFWPRGRKRK